MFCVFGPKRQKMDTSILSDVSTLQQHDYAMLAASTTMESEDDYDVIPGGSPASAITPSNSIRMRGELS